MLDVSVIIINYNSYSLLENCIDSIINKTKECNYEIIVVDNNSDTECANKLNSRFNETIRCIQLTKNIGFGRANNEGLKIARGRNILFLNPDTILITDAISIMSKYLDSSTSTGAVGGNLYDYDLNPTRSYRIRYPDLWWLIDCILWNNLGEKLIAGKSLYFNHKAGVINVAYIVGADLMVKKCILEKISPFNPVFFMYYEEIELCRRIKKTGYSIKNIPNARIQHLEGKSTKNIGFRAIEMSKSINHYFKLSYNKFGYEIFKFLYYCLSIERYIIAKIIRNENMKKYWKIQIASFNQKH